MTNLELEVRCSGLPVQCSFRCAILFETWQLQPYCFSYPFVHEKKNPWAWHSGQEPSPCSAIYRLGPVGLRKLLSEWGKKGKKCPPDILEAYHSWRWGDQSASCLVVDWLHWTSSIMVGHQFGPHKNRHLFWIWICYLFLKYVCQPNHLCAHSKLHSLSWYSFYHSIASDQGTHFRAM